MKIKRLLSLVIAAILAISIMAGCGQKSNGEKYYGENYRKELSEVDRSHLFGAMYIAYEMDRWHNLPYQLGVQTLKNMGMQSIRLGLFESQLWPVMSSARVERNEAEIQKMHDIIKTIQDADMMIVAGAYPNWLDGKGFIDEELPFKRDLNPDSNYQKWLKSFEKNWEIIATEFPELSYFEIGNEPNHGGSYVIDSGTYDMLEKADIYLDMLYAASAGIHKVNKNAIVIMGGLAEFVKLGTSINDAYISFFKRIYDNIESGEWPSIYPDDYFQAVCWHPYLFYDWDADYFVEENDRVYNYVKEREGKHKKVFFTEIGWSDKMVMKKLPGKTVQETIAVWMTDMYQTVKNRMPYVETVQVFRAFNDVRDYHWAGEFSMGAYGLFYDANWEIFKGDEEFLRETDVETGKCVIPGTPKPVAYAIQQMTGATGSLTLLQERAEQEMKKLFWKNDEHGNALTWWDELVSLM